ncbi:hypothetical protein BXT84_13650 [Sulfobacillus thermotolerans]|uniref:Transcriptional regulator n=1 Tax=Sulfobacillus thermotolerans TaxID=338644 RepID=A0ABM6RU95_9FIRM|nr:hypothetical protein BXT84_13650 [Sulfobacillus thermotolerans]
MLIVVIQSQDAKALSKALRALPAPFTQFASRGAFLDQGNTTYMIGTRAEKVPAILDVVRQYSHQREALAHGGHVPLHHDFYASPTTVTIGGATIFALPVERYIRIEGTPSA